MAFSSEESDLELRDAVLQLLEDSGALSKIKAELRSRVFQALYNSNKLRGKLPSSKASQFGDHDEDCLALSLVRDLLQGLDLNFTLSVFDAEVQTKTLLTRKETAAKLDIGTSLDEPLLSSLVNYSLNQHKKKTNSQNVDVQTLFAEQSFFAQLDKTQQETNDIRDSNDKENKPEIILDDDDGKSSKILLTSPPRSPDKSAEMIETPGKLSPLKPLSSLKNLPQLQAPSKLPSLKRIPQDPIKPLDGDSGDDAESLGDDLLSSLDDSATNEISTSQADIANCDYVENIA